MLVNNGFYVVAFKWGSQLTQIRSTCYFSNVFDKIEIFDLCNRSESEIQQTWPCLCLLSMNQRYYLLARSIQSDERAQDDRDKIKIKIHLIVPQRYAKCDDCNLI